MGEPRVLIVSNTAIKRSNSNGLCLLNALSSLPPSALASFYIQDSFPDQGVLASSFRLTDREKLHSFFSGKDQGRLLDASSLPESKDRDVQNGGGKESFFRHLVREFVWKRGRWNREDLYSWVASFKPTVILFMNGRSPFMFDIVRDLSLRFDLPVVFFSSEDEYWHHPQKGSLWDFILRRKLRKATRRLVKRTAHVIAFNDKLAGLYSEEFHLPVTTIMPSSSLSAVAAPNGGGSLFYGGNLKPYRYEALVDISRALVEIGSPRKIDVYSNDIDDEIRDRLSNCPNLVIHEAVARNELESRRADAALLIHFESFSKKARPLIQNAFSSKISDCLASGIPFLVYAPPYCGFSPYFRDNPEAVCFVSEKKALKDSLVKALSDPDYRSSLVGHALPLSKKNHDLKTNAILMKKILSEAHL